MPCRTSAGCLPWRDLTVGLAGNAFFGKRALAGHRQHAELPRGDVVLFGQLFMKHGLIETYIGTMRVNAVNQEGSGSF
jgi:hypothetical protein